MRQKLSLILASVLLTGLLSGTANAGKGSDLECGVLPPIAQGYLAHHISFSKLDNELETRTIDQFITKLDPSKAYFQKNDVTQIKASLKDIFKRLGKDCSSIEKAHQLYVTRLNEASTQVKKMLDGSFKFQENTEIVLDPKQRNWAETDAAAKEQLGKFVQFQISNYLASEMKMDQAKKQLIHRYELNAKRQKELPKTELYAIFMDAFATSLDAHSGYLSNEMLEDFKISMKLTLEGIGAALTWEDGYTTVDALIPGGAAEKSGEVQPKDKIIAVAQGEKKDEKKGDKDDFEQVIDLPLRDVVKLIRGKKGSFVRLVILRQIGQETKRLIISLKRDQVQLQDQAARLVYTTKKVGDRTLKLAVIDLPSFYGDMTEKTRSSSEDLKQLVEKAAKEKADGIVLDLSRNGGGLLSEAVRISGLFLRKGNVVATQNADQKLDVLSDDESDIAWKGPLVVLTSRLSASASEIVSGALQDYHRAVIVGGDHTFGKGTVQAMMDLPPKLGAIKVTTGLFFVPGGNSTQHRGVPADVPLPSVFSTKDMGEKSLDYSLPPKSIANFISPEANDESPALHWLPVNSDLIKKLQSLSSARVEKDPEFKKIKTELADLEKKKGTINLAQSLKKQKEEKSKDDKKKTARRGKRAQDDEEYLKQPQVSESVQVLADMIQLTKTETQAAR